MAKRTTGPSGTPLRPGLQERPALAWHSAPPVRKAPARVRDCAMVTFDPDESTPLVPATRNSAQGRSVGLLRRANLRRGGSDSSCFQDVCAELESDEKKNNRFLYFAIFGIINHVVGGSITLKMLEGWSFIDCLYFCVVTITTVGVRFQPFFPRLLYQSIY